jgi:acyl-CoA thioester hydrolase
VRIRIRWRDIDALGHVNNAVYLTYLDELLTGLLAPVLGSGRVVTTRIELDFRHELRLADAEVAARASIDRVDDTGVTVSVVLAGPDGAAALDGRVVLAAWDPAVRRTRSLTETEQLALADLAS